MKKLAFLLLLLSQCWLAAVAQDTFVVRYIEFQGLQYITPATAESYLPIKRGQMLKPRQTAAILRALYKTGFFERITLSRENNTLIIHVVERPTIGQLKITGNSVIPTDKLATVMRSLDVAEGRIYNQSVVERIRQSLLNQYYQLGRYNARVDIDVTPTTRNRVFVQIIISEGLVAKIKRISILGNHVFDESTLIKQLDITTSGWLTFITQNDRYSEAKLDTNLEKLRNFYMDHGYLHIQIKSAQAEVTPNRKSVYITIVLEEGQPYTIKSYRLISSPNVVPQETLVKQITIKPGETFSRQKIVDAEKNMTTLLGDKGYLFAAIALRPQVNDKTHDVILLFDVKPGKRAYVRHITFSNNNHTNDVVLRREVQQWEASPASTSKLEETKHRLRLLPYIKDVDMSINPVPDKEDQVDVDYKVQEDNSGQVSFKIGYSQAYHVVLGAGLDQKNFLGTGNTFGINFSQSRYEQFYGIDFTDPYYTLDGISRTFNFSISRVNPAAISNLDSGYATNEYDLGVLYGIPVGQEDAVINRIMAGVTYQNTLVNLDRQKSGKVSTQVNDFVNRHGRRYQEADIKLGYSRDSRDKAIFPTSGALQTLFLDAFAPVARGSLSFYTLNYQGKWYQPLTEQFIILTRADLGYGNSLQGVRNFPFFRNYLAGGIDSVRGYQAYTLGPRDSNGQAYGGNMLAAASLGLIFPNYISDSLRTSVFFDAGNVYSSSSNRPFGGQSTGSGPPRYSVGVEADWMTPIGPIELSLAKPLNLRRKNSQGQNGDLQEPFQFALGANF